MNILVTGGAGFIGSHIVEQLLKEGHGVIVLDNLSTGNKDFIPSEAVFIHGSILEKKSYDQIEGSIDGIIHLAAQVDVQTSMKDPEYDAMTNVMGTIAVLDFAREKGIKNLVFSSSCGVYGEQDQLPIQESASCHPLSAYALSKYAAEEYIRLYNKFYGLDGVVLRYANVYGKRQYKGENSGVISIFAHLALEKKPLIIFGDGKQTRDYIHVQDVVDATIKALGISSLEPLNIGTGIQSDLLGITCMLNSELDHEVEILYQEQKAGDIKFSALDPSLAKKQLNWEPRISLQDGIKALLN